MLLLRTTIFFLAIVSCYAEIDIIDNSDAVEMESDPIDDSFNPVDGKIDEENYVDADLYPTNDTTDDALNQVLFDLSAIPCCVTNYARLNRQKPKLILNSQPAPAALCSKPNGDFVAALWRPNRPFVYLFNKHGWIKKRITLPRRTSYSAGCVFTDSNLFYAVTMHRKILQFSINGKYQKVFATGVKFLRLAARDNKLYSTIQPSKQIRVYDVNNGKLLKRFHTTSANARGLAFDPAG